MASRRKQKEDYKQEDVLQAVVIADSFNVRFAPITRLKPRTLLPLANIPLLEYTLELLCSSDIQEVIVFCCVHAKQIKAYIANSKWNQKSCPMELTVISSEDCLSVGDALRDIDAKSLISSDFVLVNGDMVANVKLKPIIQAHKARRLKDKSMLMTMLFKKAPPSHMLRCKEEEVVIAVKPENQQILTYQKLGNMKKFDVPLEIFTGNKNVQLRYDLLDCHISICSPHVPPLFTDNFDYLSREDFVRGILVDEEIMGNTIHVHVLEEEYAARVSNLHMYDAISKDVLNRWAYPIVPDNAITENTCDRYSYGRHNTYLHKDVTLARHCKLRENVLIGKGSCVGNNSHITRSTIGKNCKIGENVKMEGAYLWDNITVEDGCILTTCVLDNHVHLKKNVKVLSGSVIAANVVIGPDVTLKPGTLLTDTPPEKSDDEEEGAVLDVSLVGEEGRGYMYQVSADSDEEAEELIHDMWGLRIESEEEDQESVSSLESEEELEADESKLFYDEIIGTLERGQHENIGQDNLILEVNSLKHAYGLQIKEVNYLLCKALVDLPFHTDPSLNPVNYLAQVTKIFKKFMPLIQNYIKSSESQSDCLTSLEEYCLDNETAQKVLLKILHLLYNSDVMEETVIINWYTSLPTEKKVLKQQVFPFIKWLQEAEEESGDDDDDEEED